MIYKEKDSYKWVILAIAFLLMTTFAISLQALPPIFEQINQDIPFSDSQAGMLMGAYAIPGIFLPFLAAFLAKRFSKKLIIIIALSIMFAGLIAFSLSSSFLTLFISRLIVGIGVTVLVVLSPLLVTIFFDQKSIGTAMGVFNTAVPFGTVVAANLFGPLGQLISWRLIIQGIAVFVGIVIAICIIALTIPKSVSENKNTEKTGVEKGRQQKALPSAGSGLWVLAFIWAATNVQLLAYVTFGPQFFQSTGMSMQKSGLLTSFIMLMPIIISPLVGLIIDKTNWKKRLILIGTILIAVSFIMIGKTTLTLPLWTILLGVGFAPIPVVVFSLLPRTVEPHQIGMGLGVLTAASNIGITIGPSAFGLLLDATSRNFFIGFLALALVSVTVMIGARREI